MTARTMLAALGFVVCFGGVAYANDGCDESCQAARKAQDPLAPISGVLTDFTSTFGPGSWASNTRNDNYQFQPVYTFENVGAGNLILRGIIPVNSAPQSLGDSRTTGIGDSLLQGFYVPGGQDPAFKLGFGPQVSLPTRTSSDLTGAGWGAGGVLVGFGGAGPLVYGGILGHLWGENSVSSSLIQPIVFYNTGFLGGSYFGYSNTITYDWRADSGQEWNVPLGLTFGKAFVQESGTVIDVNFGFYSVVQRADGAGDRQFKWAVSFILP